MVGGKTAIAKTVAAQTDLKPSQVKKVLDSVAALAEGEVKKGHPFVIPGIARIRIAFRKALPKRKGRNPFTGEEITIKARPASQVVRARPMKALKDAL
jgi:nucleoid DNA-binding protein